MAGLAAAMVAAGVRRGMELDIHTGNVAFTSYDPAAGGNSAATATELLPDMPRQPTRYLLPDQRDFFVVTLRPVAPVATR